MRFQPCHALPVVFLVLSAALAEGHELQIGLSQRIEGDSNVTATPNNTKSDGVWVVEPHLVARNRGSALRYDIEYRPHIETYFDTQGINGVDQYTKGEYEWEPNGRHSFTASHSYRESRSVILDDVGSGGGTQLEYSDRLRVRRLNVDGGYTYSFAPDWQTGLTTRYERYDYSSGSLVNNDAIGGNARLVHALRPTLTLGAQVGGRYRIYDETKAQPGSTTTNANFALFGDWEPAEHWKISVSGGPSMIWTSIDDVGSRTRRRFYTANGDTAALTDLGCAVVPNTSLLFLFGCQFRPTAGTGVLSVIGDTQKVSGIAVGSSGDQTDLTYFASGTLLREFEHGQVSAAYERYESGASGAATATIADSVEVSGYWKPTRDWVLSARFGWRREKTVADGKQTVELASPSPFSSNPGFPGAPRFIEFSALAAVPVTQRLDLKQYRVIVSASRRVSENLTATVGFNYLRQDKNQSDGDFDVYRGFVGIDYTFDSWIF